ncbi:MAG TPA: phosphopantetheine-binding protein, partial [Longimicrobiaceae bacterium]|nr:phosphopantetheine-binding protein [Longimicrobiaceae bacterium]
LRASRTGISPAEGAEAFARILGHGAGPQVAVCTRDLAALVERTRRFTREEMVEALQQRQGAASAHPRPEVSTPYEAPRSELEETLTELFQRALGIEPVGIHDHFFEMGGDSLVATQFLAAVNERFQVELPLRVLFEAPTPAQLAAAIVQRQVDALDEDLLAQMLADL